MQLQVALPNGRSKPQTEWDDPPRSPDCAVFFGRQKKEMETHRAEIVAQQAGLGFFVTINDDAGNSSPSYFRILKVGLCLSLMI